MLQTNLPPCTCAHFCFIMLHYGLWDLWIVEFVQQFFCCWSVFVQHVLLYDVIYCAVHHTYLQKLEPHLGVFTNYLSGVLEDFHTMLLSLLKILASLRYKHFLFLLMASNSPVLKLPLAWCGSNMVFCRDISQWSLCQCCVLDTITLLTVIVPYYQFKASTWGSLFPLRLSLCWLMYYVKWILWLCVW